MSKFEKSPYIYIINQKNMIIVEVKNSNSIENALKTYKFKVFKTKQIEKLRDRIEYKKPSVIKRNEKNKAKFIQKKKN